MDTQNFLKNENGEVLYLVSFEVNHGEYGNIENHLVYAGNEQVLMEIIHQFLLSYYPGETPEVIPEDEDSLYSLYHYFDGEVTAKLDRTEKIKNIEQIIQAFRLYIPEEGKPMATP